MIDIAAAIADKLEISDIAAEAREHLRPCLPVLRNALANWQDNGSFSAPGLMVAAATPTAFSQLASRFSAETNNGTAIWCCSRWFRPLNCNRRHC